MSAEDAAKLSEGIKHFGFEESLGLEGDIERLHAMSFRENEAVAVSSLGLSWIQVSHNVEIEGRHHIQTRQIASDVTSLGPVDHFDESFAVLLR